MINININYWDVHSGDSIVRPFSVLYATDKSKGKKDSSLIMWALTMLTDPGSENPLSRMSREERLEELVASYITNEHLDKVLELEEDFVEYKLSYLKKRYRFFQNMLEAREAYMKTLVYGKETSTIEDMLVKTKRIWEEFMNIKKELDVEEQKYHTKGSREESAAEKGLI